MAALLASAALCAAGSASAQDATVERTDAEWQAWVPGPDEVTRPDLAFVEDQQARDNYEKYFVFHRSDTDFATALQDLRECDAHSRGLFRGNFYPGQGQVQAAAMQYGYLAAGAGGVIAGAMMDAIMGPAELRRKRRINMRRCMNFLGYDRYGLSKEVWESFNFEEGVGEVPEAERQHKLAQQALVSSGPRPQGEDLGL